MGWVSGQPSPLTHCLPLSPPLSPPPPLRMEAVLNEWLWSEEFWLPPGTHWRDLEVQEDGSVFPRPRDLIYTLPLAFAFIALRYAFER